MNKFLSPYLFSGGQHIPLRNQADAVKNSTTRLLAPSQPRYWPMDVGTAHKIYFHEAFTSKLTRI